MTTFPGTRLVEPFEIVESRQAALEQRLVAVDGGEAAARYASPGQVMEMEHLGQRVYMVIASPLAARPRLEFLIHTGMGAVGDAVAATPIGGTIPMTRPFGPGFRLERAAGKRLVFCVAGTGLAAVRPLLAATPDLRGQRLYYGVRTHAHVAFGDELEAWAARGLDLRICLSREARRDARDREGWVTVAIAAEERDLTGTAIVVAGPREMRPVVEALGVAAGMEPGMLLTNF